MLIDSDSLQWFRFDLIFRVCQIGSPLGRVQFVIDKALCMTLCPMFIVHTTTPEYSEYVIATEYLDLHS